ncbi:MAG: Ig-like domain-containing protein [Bacteroides sp.]
MRKLRINNWSFWLLGVLLAWLLPSSAWGEKADWENLPAIKVNCTGRNGSIYNPMQISVHIEAEGKVYWIRPGGEELEVTGYIINETYYANGEPHDYSLRGNFKKVHLMSVNNCTIHSVVAEKCDKLVEFYLHVAVEKTIGLTNCPLLPKMTFTDQVETFTATDCSKLTTIEGGTISEKLDLDNCAVSTIPSCVTTIKYLDIKNCANLTKIEAKGNGRLDEVKVKNCSTLTSIDVANSGTAKFYLLANNCPQLRSIDNINTLDIANIIDCGSIEKLEAGSNSRRFYFRNCGKLEKVNGKNALRELEVENCAKFATLEGMDALETLKLEKSGSPEELTLGRSLKWLVAKDCAKLKKVTAKSASQLTKIELSNCSDVALEASDCSKLSTLSVGNSVKSLTVKSCAALSSLNGGAKVQTLTVERCLQLSTLSAGSDLESLTLLGCGKISSLDNVSSVRNLSVDACSDIRSLSWSRKSNLRSLSLKNCGQLANVAVDHCDNLQTVVVSACANLNKFDVNNSKKVTSVEANPCKEVNTEGCSELATLKVGNNLQTLQASNCTKLTKVEGSLDALTSLQCNYNTGFTTDFLKGVLQGSTTPKLESCEAQFVKLPAQLNVSKSLKNLNLYKATGLTSLTVSAGSALEKLDVSNVLTLNELDVSQAKGLKKLIFHDTEVKKVSLKGLDKLEEVYMPGLYPARLLTELICQLHDRKNLTKGGFKYNFSSSELPLVNGSVAKGKNWMIYSTNGGKDVTDQCTSTVSCEEVVPPTTTDEVHFVLTGRTRLFFETVKPTMVWLSATSDKNKFYYNDYYVAGNSSIDLKDHEHVYLFTQPGALKSLRIEQAGTVKDIALTRLPDLKELILQNATQLLSLDITKLTELSKLELSRAKDLTTIDLSKNTKLETLDIRGTKLASLDLSKHTAMKYTWVYENQLSTIKLSPATLSLWVYGNKLSSLDVSMATGLYSVDARDNALTTLTLASDKTKYSELKLSGNGLTNLDLQNATELKTLEIGKNANLAMLNLRGCTKLQKLDMSNCTAFKELKQAGETAWFLDGCTALTDFRLYGTGLDANNLSKLYCHLHKVTSGKLYVADKANQTSLEEAKKSGTNIAKENGWTVLASDGTEFTGSTKTCADLVPNNVPAIQLVIKGKLTVKFKASAKEIWIEETEGTYKYKEVTPGQEITETYDALVAQRYTLHGKISLLDISNQAVVQGITIKNHDALIELNAAKCSGMTEVDLSNMKNLAKLIINESHVKALDLAQFPALKELNCAGNELTELSFINNPLLEKVDCSNNATLKNLVALKKVGTGAAPLKELKCGGSALTTEVFNDLFCTLPERTSLEKGKLFAVKDAAEANAKLVPNNCYTSRATTKHWEILLMDGTAASLGSEDPGHACVPQKVTSITIDPIKLEHHETLILKPTIEPATADDKTVKWDVKSGKDKVQLYDDGLIEGLDVGTATLECVAQDGSGVKAAVTVTVVEKKVEKITITTSKPSPFKIGDQVQFTAKVEPEKATYRDITWSVDGSAATIDSKTGAFVAKATSDGLKVTVRTNSPDYPKTEEQIVKIENPTVTGLLLTQDNLVVKKDGKKYPLGVTLDPPIAVLTGKVNVEAAEAFVSVTCKTELDENGFVRQPIKVEVQGVQEGKQTTVTIKPEAFPSISKTFTVKVVAASEFTEPSALNLPKTLSATVGKPAKLTADVSPENATNRAIYWSLKDEESAQVVRIDVQGNITPLKQGKATVVATAVGKPDLVAECEVNVMNEIEEVPATAKLIATLSVEPNAQLQLQLAGAGDVYLQTKASKKAYQYSLTDAYYAIPVKCEANTVKIYGALTKLEAKDAGSNITAIEFTKDANLSELNVSGNALTVLELSALKTLKKLNCANNQLLQLNLVPLTELVELECGKNQISELDLTKNANLQKLSCEELRISTLNLNNKTDLKEVICYGNTFLTEVYNKIYCALPKTTDGVIVPAKEKVTSGTDANYAAMLASSGAIATGKGWKVVYLDKTTAIETTGTETQCQQIPATGINVSPLIVAVGQSRKIKYELIPADATAKVTFTSRDANVALVDNNGNVVGVAAGKVTIDVTTDVPTVKGECKVTVTEKPLPPATSIVVSPLTVTVGKTNKIQYAFLPAGAIASVTFTSRDVTIATVDTEGNVTGVKEGPVVIDVTTDDPSVKGECQVTVNAKPAVPATGIEITPLKVKVGETLPITYKFTPEGSTANLTFTSKNTEFATVDAEGKVTGVKEGTVVIEVTSDIPEVKGECLVTVTANTTVPATGIEITPLKVKVGETLPITYKFTPEGSTAKLTFTSKNTEVATVDAEGKVTGVKEGTAVIEVTSDIPEVKGECTVTVTANTTVPATGITVSPLTVEEGKTAKITYELQPKGATATVTFKSRDEKIATVDAKGNVKGIKAGTVTIDVTTDVPNVKAECKVTVKAKGTDVQDLFFANVHIMPNPFDTNIRIVLSGDARDMHYELINVTGSVLRKGDIESNEAQIETSDLHSGIYLLRLSTDTGLVKTYRLVKK